MNPLIKGTATSKTMWWQAGGLAALYSVWNDPTFQMLPDKVKYGILIFIAGNIVLRYLTDKGIFDKGLPKVLPDVVERYIDAIGHSDLLQSTINKMASAALDNIIQRSSQLPAEEIGEHERILVKKQDYEDIKKRLAELEAKETIETISGSGKTSAEMEIQ